MIRTIYLTNPAFALLVLVCAFESFAQLRFERPMTVDATDQFRTETLTPMPDGRVIAGAGSGGRIGNFDANTTMAVARYPYCPVSSETVYCVDGSGDTNHLIVRVTSRTDLPPFNSPSYSIFTFNGTVVSGADSVKDIKVQPDGKVLFSAVATVYRLLADGSSDGSFPSTIHGRRMLMYPDGRFLTDGGGYGVIKRYSIDGGPSDFSPATLDGDCKDLAFTPDGGIVIIGTFGHVNGSIRAMVARLFSDGSLDFSFRPFTTVTPSGFTRVAVQSDGKILLFNGAIRRLNVDGSTDGTFAVTPPPQTPISDFCLDAHERIVYVTGISSLTRLSGRNRVVAQAGSVPLAVESSSSLDSGWSLLTVVPIGGGWDFVDDSFPGTGNQFYRVRPAN